jgi:type I restriction enzyme M protein
MTTSLTQGACNFENSENFVVLECVNRVLEKGYSPDCLYLEHKWPMGRKEKGKLDILVSDRSGNTYLMIECKTWGEEYEKEKKKMQRDGGQLFSYFQQDKAAQYLCLYSSRFEQGKIEVINDIVTIDAQWKALNNLKEIFDHWNKNFKDNGIFEDWANAYDIEIKALTRGRLRELTEEDSSRIFNQFAEILRHNIVSDKPNAFNKIFNLFLCKIVDEDRIPTEELKFQWIETDTDEELQKRLSDLYKQGMREYLTKEVTDYNDDQIAEKLYALNPKMQDQIKEMFTKIRLHKNNEFAFKEVFDEKSFRENAVVVREVVELLQPYQLRYGHKQQFLGDFFELLLSTGIKQEAGQFFTPVPIAKFIISSLPIREMIQKKIEADDNYFLPFIIDYAAGSGHFLTEAMDEVQKIIETIDPKGQKPSIKSKLKSWKESSFDWAYEYVYGLEADYRLVKTAKVSCFLNGDGLANVIHADGLDHFTNSKDFKGKLKETSNDEPQDNGQFDILVANPPYSVSAFKNTLKYGEDSFQLYNRLTDESSEIECLFIERTKQLLKTGGWAGVILPSSILSNSGIYTDAREIILKYFMIKSIAQFGSNTFMATGTNTVTLFLERRSNTDWRKIEQAINSFFDIPKESTVNGIKNAFSTYATKVFDDIELVDYISLVTKTPNENVQVQELYKDYRTWFNKLTEVTQLKEKKAFKDKNKAEQQTELDKLFYDKIFAREKERMLYFFLVYLQQTTLIKVGEKQAEKDFIGYEFSSRRGHEGIKMFRDENGILTTKLYDETNPLNPEKANSYVYNSFLSQSIQVETSMSENITVFDTIDLIDFKKMNFEKSISLNTKKKVSFNSFWDSENLIALSEIATIQKGISITKANTLKGNIPVVAGGKEISYFHNESNRNGNVITVSASGANAGYINYWEQPIFASDCNTIISKDESIISTKLMFLFLKSIQIDLYILQKGQAQPHVYASDIEKIKIPLPNKEIQEKIIAEIEALEQKEKERKEELDSLQNEMWQMLRNSFAAAPRKKLLEAATLERGRFSFRPRNAPHLYRNGTYPFIQTGDVASSKQGKINYSQTLNDEGLKVSRLFEPETILITIAANIGNTAILDYQACFPDSIVSIRPNADVNIYYLEYFLRTQKDYLNEIAPQQAQKNLNLERLRPLPVAVPSIIEQEQIINIIKIIEARITELETSLLGITEEKKETLDKYLQ